MSSITLHVTLIVSLVQFQVILCKPFLFDLLCDYICDDDDNTTSSSSDDYFDICSCGRSPTQAPPTTKRGNIPSVDLNLPGVSLQMTNNNGQWVLNVNANPSSPANNVIPLPTGSPVGPAGPVAPGIPQLPGGPGFPGGPGGPGFPGGPGSPQLPAGPGSPPIPGGPSSPLVPGVTGAPPPGPTTAAATPAAASTAAPA